MRKSFSKPPRNCPRCGRMVEPAAGLYRCESCGAFYPEEAHAVERHLSPREIAQLSDGPYQLPVDGRPIPLTRKFG